MSMERNIQRHFVLPKSISLNVDFVNIAIDMDWPSYHEPRTSADDDDGMAMSIATIASLWRPALSQTVYAFSYHGICMSTHALLPCALAMMSQHNHRIKFPKCGFHKISNKPTQGQRQMYNGPIAQLMKR